MSVKSIKWFPNSVLRTNVDYSRKVYSFIEEDFSKCIEYVTLDEKHLDVYSYRLSDLILRIGPEILRVFNLILFNPRRSKSFEMQPDLADRILRVQTKMEARKDSFMAYLDAVCAGPMYKLADDRIELKAIPKYIVPFEVEKRVKNGKDFKVVFWWEDGYNALKQSY